MQVLDISIHVPIKSIYQQVWISRQLDISKFLPGPLDFKIEVFYCIDENSYINIFEKKYNQHKSINYK
jgi:hypothetical protein